MLFVPPVVRQEKVKSSSSGSSKVLGELIKLLKSIKVLRPKEQIDGLSVFWIGSGAHKMGSVGVLFSL